MMHRLPGSLRAAAFVAAVLPGTYSGTAWTAGAVTSPGPDAGLEIATFAGGCFWCVESDFDKVPGVVRTVSGYTGGHVDNPSYRQVSSETTGHREAVQIYFDPDEVRYDALLEIYWRSVDPTDAGGQFCDRGESYTTAIFVNSDEQRRAALESKRTLGQSGLLMQPVVTPVIDAPAFYPAEAYHQDYYRKNPLRYRFYRAACRRDARVEALWGPQAYRGIPRH